NGDNRIDEFINQRFQFLELSKIRSSDYENDPFYQWESHCRADKQQYPQKSPSPGHFSAILSISVIFLNTEWRVATEILLALRAFSKELICSPTNRGMRHNDRYIRRSTLPCHSALKKARRNSSNPISQYSA